jgi:CBS domain-containing membrane protein
MNELCVRDLMTEEVVRVTPEDDVSRVYDLMSEHGIRHLAVIDPDGELVGLVSHRDLLRHSPMQRGSIPSFLLREVLRRTRVEEIMTSEVETAEPDQPLREAADVMFTNKFGCLPVLEEGRLVGILTEADFVRHFCAEPPEIAVLGERRAAS